MNYVDLSGVWSLRQAGTEELVAANVPGDNHSALLAAGRIPDPYYGRNELQVQWIGEKDWEYSREFKVTESLLACESVYLNFDTVDTFAEVSVNGIRVGVTENMFRRYRFEIRHALKTGVNNIRVLIRSAAKEAAAVAAAQPMEIPYSKSCNTVPYINHIRKVQCHAGWDWGITLMVSGIYGQTFIQGVENARIEHVNCAQKHRNGKCEVTAVAGLHAVKAGKVKVNFSFDGKEKKVSVQLIPGLNLVKAVFEIDKPRLWWPSGHGEQELYKLSVSTGDECAERMIGLRTVEVVREKDERGVGMKFRINGRDIFCKGANWIPADAMPERMTRERYDNLLSSAVAANMNMIRVWGGGQYENEIFYDLCDQKGLLVWHDMMFSCALYPATDEFIDNVKAELDYQIRRLNSHPCMALWCGDNECVGAMKWYDVARKNPITYAINYDRLNRELERAVERLAPEFTFWTSSPCGGPGNYNDGWHDDSCGDMHYWEVWHGSKSMEAYFEVTPRFCSEFGFQSFPSREIFDTFGTEADTNVFSPVMNHHQKCHKGNANIIGMIAKYFRMPEGFDNFLYLSQVQQALAIKTGVEYWRHLQPTCMGTIYWQLNDNWPVASWASLEYGGKWKQLHYHAKRFFAPAVTMTFQRDGELEVWSVNDSHKSMEFKVKATAYDFDGKELKTWELKGPVPGGGSR